MCSQLFLLGIIKNLPDSDIGFELYKSEMWEKFKVVKYAKVFETIPKQYLNHAIILKVPIEFHKLLSFPKLFRFSLPSTESQPISSIKMGQKASVGVELANLK